MMNFLGPPGPGRIAAGTPVQRPDARLGYPLQPRANFPTNKKMAYGSNPTPKAGDGMANGKTPTNFSIDIKVMAALPRNRNNTVLAMYAKAITRYHTLILAKETRKHPDLSDYGGSLPRNTLSDLQEQECFTLPQFNAFLRRKTLQAKTAEDVPTPDWVVANFYLAGIVCEGRDIMPTVEERRVDVKLVRARGTYMTWNLWGNRLRVGMCVHLGIKLVPRGTRNRLYCELDNGTQTTMFTTQQAPLCENYPWPGYFVQVVPISSEGPLPPPCVQDSLVTFDDATSTWVPGRKWTVGRVKKPDFDFNQIPTQSYDVQDPDYPLIEAVINAEVLKLMPLLDIRVDVM